MVVDIKDMDSLEKELDKSALLVDRINILFLDVSSTCTGYAIGSVSFKTKDVVWKASGALWFDNNWSHQEKYDYMYASICEYFWIVHQIDYIVIEQYSFNKNKMMGVQVVPEMAGVIKAAAWANSVKVSSILPQSWRSTLKIKKNAEGDFKQPTKEKILTYVSIPEECKSNITKQIRKTPSDVYDALAIGIAWLMRLGFTESKMKFDNMKLNPHVVD